MDVINQLNVYRRNGYRHHHYKKARCINRIDHVIHKNLVSEVGSRLICPTEFDTCKYRSGNENVVAIFV